MSTAVLERRRLKKLRRARRPSCRPQDSEGEFLWLVSLSDLMILLFVFFVTLFSMTYKKISTRELDKIATAVTGKKPEAARNLDAIQASLLKWVVDRKLLDHVSIEPKEDALILEIGESVLFESGRFDLNEKSRELISQIGSFLNRLPKPYRLGVEGHTDDVPSGNELDNWQLSSRRAGAVLSALKLPSEILERTVLLAYADKRPLLPNVDSAARAKNRRVTLRVF